MMTAVILAALATGCAEFEIDAPRETGGAVVRAADFGFSESSARNAAALNRALDRCRESRASRLVLAPGTYNCFDEDGVRLEGFKDFTLDGQGAKLVFRRPPEYRGQPQSERIPEKASVFVRGCERVEIKDFSVDWDWATDPLALAVRCVGVHLDNRDNESYFDLKLTDLARHPKYPEPVPVQRIQAFDTDNLRFVSGEQWYFGQSEGHFGTKNEWIAPNVLRVWPGVIHPGRHENPLMGNWHSPDQNRDGVRRMKEGSTYRLQHCYYGKNGFYLYGNRHLTVRGVRILSAFGMGVVVDGEQDHWQLVDFVIAPPEGARRPITSTADGYHVVRSKGHCKLLNCTFTLNNDDSLNFHDRFTMAIPVASNALEIVNRRGEEYVNMAVGDELELRNPDFSPTGFRTRLVRKAGELNQGNLLYVDRVLPPMSGRCFLVWDRNYGTDNVIVRGCTFIDTASRNLFSPSNLTIEDCTFTRTGRHPISIVADYKTSRWCEGFGATNIVIRNCSFTDDCTLSHGIPEISTSCTPPDGWDVGTVDRGFVGGRMLIEKCRFIRPYGPVLDLPIGRDIVFRDNVIEPREGDVRAGKGAKAFVSVRGAENVVVDGERVDVPARTLAEQWVHSYRSWFVQPRQFESMMALVPRAKKAGYTGICFMSGRDLDGNWGLVRSNHNRTDRFVADHIGIDAWWRVSPARQKRYLAFKEECDRNGIDFVPFIWSVGYGGAATLDDPNLASVWPVRDVPYVVKDGRAVYAGAQRVGVGSLAALQKRNDGKEIFGGTARFAVAPARRYRVSCEIRTENLAVAPRVPIGGIMLSVRTADARLMLGSKQPRFNPTQDWTPIEFTFNSFDETNVALTVTCGANGGGRKALGFNDDEVVAAGGRFAVRALAVEELGIEQPIVREGAPFAVRRADTGAVCAPGTDYTVPSTPRHITFSGPYEPIGFAVADGLPDGTRLLVSSYEPVYYWSMQNSLCLTNPGFDKWIARSAKTLSETFGLRKWLISADEIRNECRCEFCTASGVDVGTRFARAITRMRAIVKAHCPDADIYMFADQVDPNHNAEEHCCGCHTSFVGCWNLMPKDVIMCPWNGGKCETCVAFLDGQGFRTFGFGYYDAPTEEQTVERCVRWRDALLKAKGGRGLAYTSWKDGNLGGDFSRIELWADTAKGKK